MWSQWMKSKKILVKLLPFFIETEMFPEVLKKIYYRMLEVGWDMLCSLK